MTGVGLPDFGPVQHNLAFNDRRGVTRGIHTEPWDKYVSVATGRVFAAWVDLRRGAGFGTSYSVEIDPGVAVFVPRGVGNSYQVLEDATTYTYLINDHWRREQTYPALDLGDPTVGISWPIPLATAEISAKDRANPSLAEVTPVPGRRTLVLGGDGQLGRALAARFSDAEVVGRDVLDLTDVSAVSAWAWSAYDVVINAAAWTDVDAAETGSGRRGAWAVNAQAPALLARVASAHRLTLVHYSTDYVFDGDLEPPSPHTEDEPVSPWGSTRSRRRPETWPWPAPRGTTCCGRPG